VYFELKREGNCLKSATAALLDGHQFSFFPKVSNTFFSLSIASLQLSLRPRTISRHGSFRCDSRSFVVGFDVVRTGRAAASNSPSASASAFHISFPRTSLSMVRCPVPCSYSPRLRPHLQRSDGCAGCRCHGL